jgi:hypothetical protein
MQFTITGVRAADEVAGTAPSIQATSHCSRVIGRSANVAGEDRAVESRRTGPGWPAVPRAANDNTRNSPPTQFYVLSMYRAAACPVGRPSNADSADAAIEAAAVEF